MYRRFSYRVGASMLALALGAVLTAPLPSYAQTGGMDRRDDRQEDRQDGRDAKDECKDANGNRIDCRQEKRDVKHGGAGEAAAPEVKTDEAPK